MAAPGHSAREARPDVDLAQTGRSPWPQDPPPPDRSTKRVQDTTSAVALWGPRTPRKGTCSAGLPHPVLLTPPQAPSCHVLPHAARHPATTGPHLAFPPSQ